MSFGEGNLHDEVDRLKGLNGELCAEINRQEKRIRELESLVRDYHECGKHECNDSCPHRHTGTRQFCDFGPAGWWNDRIAELGIEVDE